MKEIKKENRKENRRIENNRKENRRENRKDNKIENQIKKNNILKSWIEETIDRYSFIRILLAIIGGAIFGLFSNPYLGGVLNIGNITGMIVSLIMIGYALLFNSVNSWIKKLASKKTGRRVVAAFSFVFSVVLVTAVVIGTLMITATTKTGEGDEVLIVLGCKVNGDQPSAMLGERLMAAKQYLDAHEEAVCIVSGGKGDDEGISEAQCMYNWLVKNGVEKDRIYLEDKSTSTLENIEFSTKILEQEKLGTNVAIATNEFHIFRAGTVAEKNGLTYSAVPAKTDWWLVPSYSVREMYGIVLTALLV